MTTIDKNDEVGHYLASTHLRFMKGKEMTDLTFLFALAVVVAGLLASISVWSPRNVWIKITALVTATAFVPIGYLSLAHLLSLPKPVAIEWWLANAQSANVIGSSIHENEAIYVWLMLEDVAEPRAYALPWSRDLAEQLQTAQREAEESKSHVRMRLPFDPTLDDREPKFYALPQPPLLPKDLETQPAQIYNREADA